MLDNLQLIPEGAFEPLASVMNNLIDKLSMAVGFVFIPKGKRKDHEEAVRFFIDGIKENEEMPLMAKAVAISNARKSINEYGNQVNIVSMCSEYLTNDANVNGLDNDWLAYFMDRARLISAEEVQIIFAKLLAEECNKNGSVSKALVNTLSIMDAEMARGFGNLCKHVVDLLVDGKEKKEALVTTVIDLERDHLNITFTDIVNLTSLGLIEYDVLGGYGHSEKEAVVKYGDKTFTVSGNDNIPLGHVNLTKTGTELANIISCETTDVYYEVIIKYFENNKCSIKEQT